MGTASLAAVHAGQKGKTLDRSFLATHFVSSSCVLQVTAWAPSWLGWQCNRFCAHVVMAYPLHQVQLAGLCLSHASNTRSIVLTNVSQRRKSRFDCIPNKGQPEKLERRFGCISQAWPFCHFVFLFFCRLEIPTWLLQVFLNTTKVRRTELWLLNGVTMPHL